MGRQGVAYTFVTPEEGPELTRIEVLINKLLVRDEIQGFLTTAAGDSRQAVSAKEDSPPKEDAPPKSAPPGQRPRRRHRRAL